MRRTVIRLVSVLLVAMLGCVVFVGCSATNESASAPAEPEMLVIGEKTDTALSIVFDNQSGVDIANLALIPAGSTVEPEFLMADDEVFSNETKAIVYAEPLAEDALYDVVFESEGVRHTLHDINFDLLEEATIRMEDDIAYIEAVIDGNVVTSLNEEYEHAHAAEIAEAEAAAAAAAAAEAEAAAAAAAEAEAAYYEEPVYYDDSSSYDQGPAQSEDACVSDVVLN